MKISQKELKQLIDEAKLNVQVGAQYRHYKSADLVYEVQDIVIQEADNQPCVIYQAMYGSNITFSRPLSAWLEEVDNNGTNVPRFTKI